MTFITHNPCPPYRARAVCLGHALDYAMTWQVVDAYGNVPWSSIEAQPQDTIIDEAWCRAEAERLNKGITHA